MTENEAIKILDITKYCLDKSTKGICKINCGDCKENIPIAYQEKAYELAITALKEIQQYRKLGSVEELTTANRYIRLAKMHGTTGEGIDKCVAYEEIGTVEECREAMEKQKAKKPPVIGADFMVGRDDDGNPIWEHDYVCSECGMGIAEEYICCPYCGTYINWSEVTENE